MTDATTPDEMSAADAFEGFWHTARWTKVAERAVAVATLIAVLTIGGFELSRQSSEISQLRSQQAISHATGIENQQILRLIEGAVGPAATQASQSNLHQLIVCVEASIDANTDVDTGKPVPSLPKGCTP